MTAAATLTLAGFLTARYDELEAHAKATTTGTLAYPDGRVEWITTDPDRYVLADLEAKRQIMELHKIRVDVLPDDFCMTCSDLDGFDEVGLVSWPCPTLRALALPYADHPDYREEWKP